MGSCRGETQDKRPKTARRSPPCPPELLFLTSARPTLRTSRRQRSTDTSCSTSRRRRVLWSSQWETVTRPMTTTSTTYRREVTESAGMASTTTSTSTSVRAPPSRARSRSSSFDALKKSLVGVHKFIQATDLSEASEGEVEKQLRSTDQSKLAVLSRKSSGGCFFHNFVRTTLCAQVFKTAI